MRRLLLIGLLSLSMLLTGCWFVTRRVERTPVPPVPETPTAPAAEWTRDDFRGAAESLIGEALAGEWYQSFVAANLRNPVLMIRSVQNLAEEHIPIENLERELSRVLLRSGKVRFVALREDRPIDPDAFEEGEQVDPLQALADATGADFAIKSILTRIGNTSDNVRSKIYLIELSLVDLQTGQLVHQGTYTIQKQVNR